MVSLGKPRSGLTALNLPRRSHLHGSQNATPRSSNASTPRHVPHNTPPHLPFRTTAAATPGYGKGVRQACSASTPSSSRPSSPTISERPEELVEDRSDRVPAASRAAAVPLSVPLPRTAVETISTEEDDPQDLDTTQSIEPCRVVSWSAPSAGGTAQSLLTALPPQRPDVQEASLLFAKCLEAHVEGARSFDRALHLIAQLDVITSSHSGGSLYSIPELSEGERGPSTDSICSSEL